jgi:N,N'-diacetyllegionaminate synthase
MCRDLEVEIAINELCLGYVDSLSTLEMTHSEVIENLSLFKQNISILHCTTEYPCPPDQACLTEISRYLKKYESHVVGYSDHTLGVQSALLASGLGAMIFEKHVTDDVTRSGPDHSASLAVEDLPVYLNAIKLGKAMTLGAPDSLTSSEIRNATVARRSLHRTDTGFKLQRPYSGYSAYFERNYD